MGAVALADGHVAFSGGEMLALATGAWSELPPRPHEYWYGGPAIHAVARLGNALLFVGGVTAGGTTHMGSNRVESFDLTSGVWREVAKLSNGRVNPVVVALHDGRALVVAGHAVEGMATRRDPVGELEAYDPAVDEWKTVGAIEPRRDVLVSLLRDHRVIIAGGRVQTQLLFEPTTRVEVFDPKTNTVHRVADLPRPPYGVVAADDGDALALLSIDLGCDQIWRWSRREDAWSLETEVPRAIHRGTLAPLQCGGVLIVGGTDASGVAARWGAVYDPRDKSWFETLPPQARVYDLAIPLPDGGFVFVGGLGVDGALAPVIRWTR